MKVPVFLLQSIVGLVLSALILRAITEDLTV